MARKSSEIKIIYLQLHLWKGRTLLENVVIWIEPFSDLAYVTMLNTTQYFAQNDLN